MHLWLFYKSNDFPRKLMLESPYGSLLSSKKFVTPQELPRVPSFLRLQYYTKYNTNNFLDDRIKSYLIFNTLIKLQISDLKVMKDNKQSSIRVLIYKKKMLTNEVTSFHISQMVKKKLSFSNTIVNYFQAIYVFISVQ